jgi:hypothetical protein
VREREKQKPTAVAIATLTIHPRDDNRHIPSLAFRVFSPHPYTVSHMHYIFIAIQPRACMRLRVWRARTQTTAADVIYTIYGNYIHIYILFIATMPKLIQKSAHGAQRALCDPYQCVDPLLELGIKISKRTPARFATRYVHRRLSWDGTEPIPHLRNLNEGMRMRMICFQYGISISANTKNV